MKQAPIIFSLDHDGLANTIQEQCQYELGKIKQHQFPDEEIVIQIDSNVIERELVFIISLDRPNIKLVPLLFAAKTARSLGATKITLIAPYLAYMRQDKVFEAGQGITSKYFAELISHYFDSLITIEPHLHRWHTLEAIYDIPTTVLHVTDNIAQWIQKNIQKPILIGPDAESLQWVEEIAKKAKVPFLILEKIRKGDEDIEVSIPNIEKYQTCIPVLIDDIISTGMTMIGTVKRLKSLNMLPPTCIGVHAVFAGDAYQKLLDSGVEKIITCNTIEHSSNSIDISTNIINYLSSS